MKPHDFYNDPDASARRAAKKAEGFTAIKFDPAGAYTSDGHTPPEQISKDSAHSVIKSEKRLVQNAICSLAHMVNLPLPGLFVWHSHCRHDRFWFENFPPDGQAEMAKE